MVKKSFHYFIASLFIFTFIPFSAQSADYTLIGGHVAIDARDSVVHAALVMDSVELKVVESNNQVEVSWTTFSEEVGQQFIVERSEDGVEFYKLEKSPTQSATADLQQYQFVDEYPYYGPNFYRLRQISPEGEVVLSKAIALQFEMKSQILLFPNPVTDDINIRLESDFEEEVVIEISDRNGVLIFTKEFENIDKYMKIRIEETNIKTCGSYFMKIQTNSETVMQQFMAGY